MKIRIKKREESEMKLLYGQYTMQSSSNEILTVALELSLSAPVELTFLPARSKEICT
jgi:hypothetical protein